MQGLHQQDFNQEERRALLGIARRAIVERVVNERSWQPESADGRLMEPRGAFVTLEWRGQLRGCVGQVEAQKSVARTVARCAVAAALEDSRFAPLKPGEVDELVIEISVLSALQPIEAGKIEIGRHGLIVECENYRGLLLPQVAVEHHWERERFLSETCRKAGLPLDAWKSPDTRLLSFTAEVFSEAELGHDTQSKSSSTNIAGPKSENR